MNEWIKDYLVQSETGWFTGMTLLQSWLVHCSGSCWHAEEERNESNKLKQLRCKTFLLSHGLIWLDNDRSFTARKLLYSFLISLSSPSTQLPPLSGYITQNAHLIPYFFNTVSCIWQHINVLFSMIRINLVLMRLESGTGLWFVWTIF